MHYLPENKHHGTEAGLPPTPKKERKEKKKTITLAHENVQDYFMSLNLRKIKPNKEKKLKNEKFYKMVTSMI